MWIVRIALQRPYTFLVMALTIVLATPYMLLTMPTDILPDINIPVISIIWNYSGLVAQDMGDRITGPAERILTTTVNDIEHIEFAVLQQHRDHQDLLPARRQYRHGHRPDRWRASRSCCECCRRARRRR